jgi:ferritin
MFRQLDVDIITQLLQKLQPLLTSHFKPYLASWICEHYIDTVDQTVKMITFLNDRENNIPETTAIKILQISNIVQVSDPASFALIIQASLSHPHF